MGLVMGITAHHRLEQSGALAWRCRDAILARRCWERASTFLGTRDLLAAPFLLHRRRTWRVSPWGCAPWSQGAFLGRSWRRRLLSCIAHAGWRARQREGPQGGAPRSTDELGDASEPFFVEVVDGAVVQKLTY